MNADRLSTVSEEQLKKATADIKKAMVALGVDRAWLAKECGWSMSNVVNVLAPKGSNRSPKAFDKITKVLDAERQRRLVPEVAFQCHQLVLRPSQAEFNKWSEAHLKWASAQQTDAAHPGVLPPRSLVDWAMASLNALSERRTLYVAQRHSSGHDSHGSHSSHGSQAHPAAPPSG
jgi:hypothetical protein